MHHGRTLLVCVALAAGCAQVPVAPESPPAPDVLRVVDAAPEVPPPAVVEVQPEAPTVDAEPVPVVAPEPEPAAAPPATPETWEFTLEDNEPWPRPAPGTLGTCTYPPSAAEQPFVEKAFGETSPMGYGPVLELSRDVGTYGAWFGVVRGYRTVPERNETRLLLESKHFDGLTDTHILCLSFNGGGDFVAILPGTDHGIGALSVLRVYGTIQSVKDDVPRVRAEFARQFAWGQFCFMNLVGDDRTNPRWRGFCKLDLTADDVDIYAPFPDPDYYHNLLGDPEAFVKGDVVVEVPLD